MSFIEYVNTTLKQYDELAHGADVNKNGDHRDNDWHH